MSKLFLSCCSALLFAFNASGEETALTLGYAEFPPFTYTNNKNQADGVLFKKAQQVILEVGYQLTPLALPTKRLKKYIASGKVDLWLGIKPSNELKALVIAGKQQVGTVLLNIYALTDQKTTQLSDLNGKRLIVIRGYSYGGAIDYIRDKNNHISIEITNDHESAFSMLAKGRADYLLAYQQPSQLALQHVKINNVTVNKLFELPVFFIVSKQVSNAKDLIAKLDQALLKICEE